MLGHCCYESINSLWFLGCINLVKVEAQKVELSQGRAILMESSKLVPI